MSNTIELCKNVAKVSNDFELTNTELKRKYIISNIMLYNYVVSKLSESMGTFGTSYPFIEQAIKTGEVPYLPIHPVSLRKTWQKDDEPYNFIYDYLSALTDFNIAKDLKKLLTETRRFIATTYNIEQLYDLLIQEATEPSKRRSKELTLKRNFERRIESWKK